MTNEKITYAQIDDFLFDTLENGISDIIKGVYTFVGENHEDALGYFDDACDLIKQWADETEIEVSDNGDKTFWGTTDTEEICIKYLRYCPYGYGRMPE